MTAQPTHDLQWSPALSARAGAESLESVYWGLTTLERRVLPPRWTKESTGLGKTAGVSYRVARHLLLDAPLAYLAVLTQHEIFGHGATIRHAGARASGYELRLPFPYGPGGGLTKLPENRRFEIHENLWLRANGMNANLLLSQTVRDQAVRHERLSYSSALLGLQAHLDLPLYVWGATDESPLTNDVANYVRSLEAAQRRLSPDDVLSSTDPLETLQGQARMSLADPFTWLALWTLLHDYGWEGRSGSSLWTLNVGSVRYLPSVHLVLSPFGSEFLLEHLLVHGDRLWTLSMRGGTGPWAPFGGLGLRVAPLLTSGPVKLAGRMDLWSQPELVFSEASTPSESSSRTLGGRVEATVSIQPSSEWPVSTIGTLGYKTEGFVLGTPLDAGLLVELGLRIHSPFLK